MCTSPIKYKDSADYRMQLRRAITASHNRLSQAVNRFNNPSEDNKPINSYDLDLFPLGVWVDINEKLKVKKRKNRFKDYLNFDVIMQKDAEFGEHFHNDVIESTEVISGEMLDTSDGKIYKKGDVANWDEGVRHTPISTKETELHVLFKRK